MGVVEATRRRALWLVLVASGCYILALALLGLAFWLQVRSLMIAGLIFLAIGTTASALTPLGVLVADPAGRATWWTNASRPARVLSAGSLVVRLGVAILVWYMLTWALSH
jgi:hypothetical protein